MIFAENTGFLMIDFNQKLGVTRSLKPILHPVIIDSVTLIDVTSNYSQADYFDAYALFQYLLARELASLGRDSPRIETYDKISRFHKGQLTIEKIRVQMKALRLATIFDVIEFGKSRADPIFV